MKHIIDHRLSGSSSDIADSELVKIKQMKCFRSEILLNSSNEHYSPSTTHSFASEQKKNEYQI